METKNLLLTSISAKLPLIQKVRHAIHKFDPEISLFGSDSNPNAIGRYFVDTFWQMPPFAEMSLQRLIDYCHAHAIGYIIPTRDGDLLWLSKNKAALREAHIFVFVSNEKSVSLCHDKWAFFQSSASAHLIQTSVNIDDLERSHYVVKERFGAGSQSMVLNVQYDQAKTFAQTLQNPIFQPFIAGKEYSVDSYITEEGSPIGSIVRLRELVINGESKITRYEDDPEIVRIVEELLLTLKLTGHIVTQVIRNDQGIFVIECNARFGGASTLSYTMGLESFYWFLQECHSQTIHFSKRTDIIRQIRAEQDFYFGY